VDDKFTIAGLPANLSPEPGVNSGFKGMQLSVTQPGLRHPPNGRPEL